MGFCNNNILFQIKSRVKGYQNNSYRYLINHIFESLFEYRRKKLLNY